jgi:hypothetical protein
VGTSFAIDSNGNFWAWGDDGNPGGCHGLGLGPDFWTYPSTPHTLCYARKMMTQIPRSYEVNDAEPIDINEPKYGVTYQSPNETMWYKFTPTNDSNVDIWLYQGNLIDNGYPLTPNFVFKLTVYEGTTVEGESDDRIEPWITSFVVTTGHTYLIKVVDDGLASWYGWPPTADISYLPYYYTLIITPHSSQ